jgi:hypothetical protein
MAKEKNFTFVVGCSKRFGLGFSIDQCTASIDFLCFWIAVEF